MARLTSDPNDPDIERGIDTKPRPQSAAYLILSEEERAKGFVRPVRKSYLHIGPKKPQNLRDLTDDERRRYRTFNYVKYEEYPEEHPALGRFWTQVDLDKATKGGCQTVTKMSLALAETYARDPKFYGATFCYHCQMHLPVEEFVWDGTDELVGS